MSILTETTTFSRNQGYYAKAVNFAKMYVKPRTLDAIEYLFALNIPIASTLMAATQATGYSFNFTSPKDLILGTALAASSMAVGIKSLITFQTQIKSPLIKHNMRDIIESSKPRLKSALIFRTTEDPYDMAMNHVAVSHFQKLAKKHSIEILDGSSKTEIQKRMLSNEKKYDKILIEAHATSESIVLAPDTLLTNNSHKTIKWLNDHIEYGGLIAIKGCSAGQGENNIAREISAGCPNATVYASSADIYALQGFDLDEEGIPAFNDGIILKGKDTTRIYRNGISL